MRSAITLALPDWVREHVRGRPARLATLDERMRLVIDLSRQNAERGTGGPFGAAVFEADTGRLVAAGVNLVVAGHCSSAHAEIVGLSLAQQALGSYTLAEPGRSAMQLVTSTEPCAMCTGAICWAGLAEVVCGATGADARAVGFDEGPKRDDWVRALKARGIKVVTERLRPDAAAVLETYRARGGLIYNA